MSTTPRVFLTDLHAYNCGDLHGKWVDATDEDELNEAVQEILASSPHPGGEEWFITDYDNFEGYKVGEYEPLSKVAAIGAAIDEHGAAVAVWLDDDETNFERLDQFTDYYYGETSEEDYEEEVFNEATLGVFKAELERADEHSMRPGALRRMFEEAIEPYLDTKAAADGLGQDMTFIEHDGTTYAFRDNA